jgi:hypothetical protein
MWSVGYRLVKDKLNSLIGDIGNDPQPPTSTVQSVMSNSPEYVQNVDAYRT